MCRILVSKKFGNDSSASKLGLALAAAVKKIVLRIQKDRPFYPRRLK
jgi:hypothetical protein